ncbi:MAG: DUF547 domain-containing protein [Rhodospirillaceae bacterium]|nr:DUF547 domain-containing protein [Rhodospirillaceae bacterium]HAA91648.1 DUF547 domain-containing protein [Rhodospirillaceae bacterium]
MFIMLAGFGSGERLFAPSADLWERWQENDPNGSINIEHDAWKQFLAKYLRVQKDGANRLRYRDVSRKDRESLVNYIGHLSAQPISRTNRAQQMAFWINLYNALTVKVTLDHYPVKSIRDIDISPGLFADGPWGKQLIKVEGVALSLNDIEHRILRPIWKDPRIHYAVNCASIGCPDLQPRPFSASSLDTDLNAAARAYINDKRGVTIKDGAVSVSKIYDWFIEDFGDSADAVLAHIIRYARPSLKTRLEKIATISDAHYDWSLNDAAP